MCGGRGVGLSVGRFSRGGGVPSSSAASSVSAVGEGGVRAASSVSVSVGVVRRERQQKRLLQDRSVAADIFFVSRC